MNRLLIFSILLFTFGCAGAIRHASGTFEHIVIKKNVEENPSFAVLVEGYYPEYNSWLKEEIENALMYQKVSVISFGNKRQVITKTTGEGKSLSANNSTGSGISKDKIDVTTTTELQSQINADYLFKANYDHWKFSVILIKTQEIIAKGTFTSLYVNDIKNNIKLILEEMGITPQLQ